jgi:hypothetical protein
MTHPPKSTTFVAMDLWVKRAHVVFRCAHDTIQTEDMGLPSTLGLEPSNIIGERRNFYGKKR